ncbi:hypothetical protein ABZ319_20625 [Nocardia sp. NPDC005978]|uniref:hypothetical protein n=1 Tax=Nocardia sp. NPDC005978 TaxID=3156725 RepID=UPI0033A25D0F
MTAEPAKELPRCELCGGRQIGNLGLRSHDSVGIHPDRRTFYGKPRSSLRAVVCLRCGHTKLFARELSALQEDADEHPEWFTW